MSYYLRQIPFGDSLTLVPVLVQAENGPCPLIAIANFLLLRGMISISVEKISFEELVVKLQEYLQRKIEKILVQTKNSDSGSTNDGEEGLANLLKNIEDALQLLPVLERGIDVNVVFKSAQFEFTPEIALFDAFEVSLVHMWIYDPKNEDLCRVLGNESYNSITSKLLSDGSNDLSSDDANIIRSFLSSTASQMTDYGMKMFQASALNNELYILFRNNHFSVILKHENLLYELVTDMGIIIDQPLFGISFITLFYNISLDETFIGRKHFC